MTKEILLILANLALAALIVWLHIYGTKNRKAKAENTYLKGKNRFVFTEAEYNLADVIIDIKSMIASRIGDKNISFDADIDPFLPKHLYGDEFRVRQVLYTLLRNAVKYTTKGSITFKLSSESYDKETIILNIEVTDTGCGIPPISLERLKEAFSKGDADFFDMESEGTSIANCYQITRLLNGGMTVESELSKGTKFTASIHQKLTDNYEPVLSVNNRGKLTAPEAKFLIVDDNKVNLKVAKSLLATYKAAVTTANSGAAALELIQAGSVFDLIFMDHLMPDMDGIETATRIWELQGENLHTPIIALTANTGREVEELFYDAGMCDFVPKPIVMKHLEYVLEKWLPENKKVYEGGETEEPKPSEVLKTAPFDPDTALSHLWDDKKIYIEILKLYKEQSPELIERIENGSTMEDQLDAAGSLVKLSKSAGAVRLPKVLNDMINICKTGERRAFNESVTYLKQEYHLLMAEIEDYLGKEDTEDILTMFE